MRIRKYQKGKIPNTKSHIRKGKDTTNKEGETQIINNTQISETIKKAGKGKGYKKEGNVIPLKPESIKTEGTRTSKGEQIIRKGKKLVYSQKSNGETIYKQ